MEVPAEQGRAQGEDLLRHASLGGRRRLCFRNEPKLFPETYRRYMERSLRENIGFGLARAHTVAREGRGKKL